MGWLPIRSGEWTPTYEQTYCSCTRPPASVLLSLSILRWGWSTLVYFFVPLCEKDSCLPGPPSACAVQDFRNPGSLHLLSGRQSISCWALVSGSWCPAAPPASPIYQYHLSVLNSAGAGQPWTWIIAVLNRAGLTRHSISCHSWAAVSAHGCTDFCNCLALIHLRPTYDFCLSSHSPVYPHPVITAHTEQASRRAQFPAKLWTSSTSWSSLWHLNLLQEKM